MVTGLKLLSIIAIIELAIMVLFSVTNFDKLASPWLVSLLDPLILSVLSSYFIYRWVLRPMRLQARKNSLFAAALEQLSIGVLITDNRREDNPIVYANSAFLRVTGYDENEVLGRNPRFLKGPESIQEVAREISQGIQESRPVEAVQKNYRKDGTCYWNELNINPVLNAKGKTVNYIGLSQDVTPRVEMELRLRELAQAVQQAGEAIVIVDRAGDVEYANPTFCRNTGYDLPELKAMGGLRYIGADEGAGVFPSGVRKMLESGQVWAGRHPFPRKDGGSFECLSSIAPIRNAEGSITHYVGVHRDISELVALEGRLVQAKKMEAIGTLVGGIAHDFNNILAGMLGNIYMALREMNKENAAASNRLRLVEKQGHQAADMIRQLLSFARKGQVKLVPVKVNELIRGAIQQASAADMPTRIRLTPVVPDDSAIVRGDFSLLQQVLVNLLNNARDAVNDNPDPHIDIIVDEIDASPKLLDQFPMEKTISECEWWVRIRVRDNGQGMQPEVMERVFDPFFTTKAAGRGTGLGMAMVKGCIGMHLGRIDVSSTPGMGTEFTVMLPGQSDACVEP